jgi:5,6-dimethylbenzimidazole synthase
MTDPTPFGADFQSELGRLFRLRRDVRRFREDRVPEALVEEILVEAGFAPSVGLSEPWRYVRVDEGAARTAVRASFERCNADALTGYQGEDARLYASLKLAGLDVAPVQLAVFCDAADGKGKGLGTRTMPEMRAYSVVCSIMVLWLAARARGLGMGWVSVLDPLDVARTLDVPEDWRLIAYLCIGWPEEEGEVPELEKAGWEIRDGVADRLL